MNRLALIMLEGFSETYLSKKYTPFLYQLAASNSHVKLQPMFAFRGIEATIFTGLEPTQHGIWTEFKLKHSVLELSLDEFKKSKGIKLVDAVDKIGSDRLSRLTRYGLRKISKRSTQQMTNLVPSRVGGFFEPALKQPIYAGNVLGSINTLFDELRADKNGFTYIEPPPVGVYNPFQILEENIAVNPQNVLWYIKYCEHDLFGHHYGPKSKEMLNCLMAMDKKMACLFNFLQSNFPNITIAFISAHGMSEVKGQIDVNSHLKTLDIKPNRDYLIFLDSTMARFWFFNKGHQSKVTHVLKQIEHGHILTEADLAQLNVPVDPTNGHLIFALDEGYVVHPSYFHFKHPPKGMHGYAYSQSDDSYAPIIISKPNLLSSKAEEKYLSVQSTLLRCLGENS
jgi:predicted AlkP superfamily pyrophosphatase or phosphodiesterase